MKIETLTNEQILKKAIEKAVKGGYYTPGLEDMLNPRLPTTFDINAKYFYRSIIFSHDFAKAFWTDEDLGRTCYMCDGSTDMNGWRKHLQFMVLEPEPLKYLEKFLHPTPQ